MNRLLFICFVFVAWVTTVYSQTEKQYRDWVIDNDYIIRVESIHTINDIKNILNVYGYAEANIEQIMCEPFILYRIRTSRSIKSNHFSEIKQSKGLYSIYNNRYLELRNVPDDPRIGQQWQYNNDGSFGGKPGADMKMFEAWDFTTGGTNSRGDTIVVCVIDDGVNGNHEDIKSNMWINHQEIPGNGIDDDGNGYVDDYYGWNVGSLNDDVYKGGGHGTPVAGIIGAKGNNGVGVSGVNWDVKILPVDYNNGTEADAISSYAYAYAMRKLYNESGGQKGAFIVATNTSWGIDDVHGEDAPLWCDLYDALGSIGILNIAATTNRNSDVDINGDLPTTCTSEYLVAVTNIDMTNRKVIGAGYGRKSIDLGAYGQQAFTLTRAGYGNFGGTSGATPHVTGLTALLYSVSCPVFDSIVISDPAGAALIVKDMIFHSVDLLPDLNAVTTTGGKLNAYTTVLNQRSICENNTPPVGISVEEGTDNAKVFWLVGTEEEISLRYRRFEDFQWTVISPFKNGDTLSGLDFCTEYEFQISSQAGHLPGEYSYSKFFKTEGCCGTPEIKSILQGGDFINIVWENKYASDLILKYRGYLENDTMSLITDNRTINLENLIECSSYQVSFQSVCSDFGSISPESEELLVSTQCGKCTQNTYCFPLYNRANQEWIKSFSIESDTFFSTANSLGYTDYAGAKIYDLFRDSTYSFTVEAGFRGNSYNEHFKIYIDLNQDGEWSEDELVYRTQSSFRNNLEDGFYVPKETLPGYTKMRLILSYEDFESACENEGFEFGKVEDYCIYILDGCINRLDSEVTNIKENSVEILVLNNEPHNDSLKLYWREIGIENWNLIVDSDVFLLSGLDKCTEYEYYIEKVCDDKNYGETALRLFKTSCGSSTSDIGSGYKIYPNPSYNHLIIQSGLDDLPTVQIEILDVIGHVYYISTKIYEEDKVSIDISQLKSGIYFLKISDGMNSPSKVIKFIKL